MPDEPLVTDGVPWTRRPPETHTLPSGKPDEKPDNAPTKAKMREALKGFVSELLTVTDPKRMRELNLTIQRHVVAMQILGIAEGSDDDVDVADLHKQMTLLNRMLEGEPLDPSDPTGAGSDADQIEQAAEILRARGIDDVQAARLVNVLGALMSRVDAGETDAPGETSDGPR